MCGIAGILHLDGAAASPSVLKRMTDIIAHRGPDGEGQWVEENVGIGHRRLAIIDLSAAGHQPMISPDHRYVLSYNGEITILRSCVLNWNRRVIGFDLKLIVKWSCAAEWGPECVNRFNGMFAYAIWDRKEALHLLGIDMALSLCTMRNGGRPFFLDRTKSNSGAP